MELFFEAVMKSLSCYQEHMSRCAPAVTEMFELVKSMFIIIGACMRLQLWLLPSFPVYC